MAWTYVPAQLSTSQLYQVRFLIGDTDTNDQLLQDEEINFQISQIGSVNGAAVACCENIASKFARQADYSLGPYAIKASQKAMRYLELCDKLKRNSIACNSPYFYDPSRIIFDVDMMNYDGVDEHDDGEV